MSPTPTPSDAATPASLRSHLAEKPAVRIIYTDLDGTLLGSDGSFLHDERGRPTAFTAAALVAAMSAGLDIVAVSGRKAETLRHDARLLGLSGAIAEAGTIIFDADHQPHVRWGECPPDVADTPRAALAELGALDLLLAAFPGDLRPYEPWDEGRDGGYLLHGRIDVARADAVLADAGLGWAKVVDNGGGGTIDGEAVSAYHLLARGVGKGPAVAEDLERRGIDADAAIAIGDSVEDQTMAAVVGTYVSVANGQTIEGRSATADNRFGAPRANGAGVAWVIDQILADRAGRS